MVRRMTFASLAVAVAIITSLAAPAECGSIGAGVHYLKTVGEIKDTAGFDENSFGLIGSYQHGVSMLRLEGDVEWVKDFGGSDHSMIQPQAYALIGKSHPQFFDLLKIGRSEPIPAVPSIGSGGRQTCATGRLRVWP